MSIEEDLKNDMSECCLYNKLSSCSSYISNRFNSWPSNTINLSDLKHSVVSYLVNIGVISKFNQGSYNVSECDLILNRLTRYIDIENPYLKICPLHRYTFGIGWKISTHCAHIDHKESFNLTRKRKRKQYLPTSNRVAPFHLIRYLVQFPYGGSLCGTHLNQIYSTIQAQQSAQDELNALSDIHSYEIKVDKSHELNDINMLLISVNESPIKSQATIRLEEQTPGSIRRLTAKLRHVVSVTASNYAEGIAPGQGEMLLQLAQLNNITERRSSNASASSNGTIDEQYLEYLIKMYQAYEEKNLPFSEQVRVLSLIPQSWNLSSTVIQEKFNCSSYAVKTARQLNKLSDTPLHIEEKSPKIRERLDPKKIDYFINWIVESNLLTSIPWGNTNLKLESGETISIPRQMLQAQQSQIIYLYKQHCIEKDVDAMSDRTIYSILNTLHVSEQKVLSGIDDFVKAALDGWTNLKKIIQQLPLSRQDKNQLNTILENSKLYLQSKYGCRCGEAEQTTTHCTIFALSERNNAYYSQACNHIHDMFCEDCRLISELFDKVEDNINTIVDEEVKGELFYDFKLVWESIFQLMAHRIRASQQENQKKKYIAEMDETTAFLTVDWSQKILPQQFREAQSAYYGKKGMSVLVGSFVFKVPSQAEPISNTYMVALSKCSQTEFETLCAGQLILEQFHRDHPHISKLIKRSDNASVLAGNCTVQYEKAFCDSLGIKLLMRDYSEVQYGKSICDRLAGSAKLRMRAFMNAGNDVMNGFDIKKSFEYAGGIKNLKVAVAEVLDASPEFQLTRIPELSSIRNIIYNDTNFVLRKATGIGVGKTVEYEDCPISTNVVLIDSFEKYEPVRRIGGFLYIRRPPRIKKSTDEYVSRIRNARNPDGTKKFQPSQYLTNSQVQSQIKILSKPPKTQLVQSKNNNYKSPLLSINDKNEVTSDEEDERAVKVATQLENLKKIILDEHS